MVSIKTKNSYSEVFELLKYINREDLDKIPMDILITIKDNRNEEYVPKIDLEKINESLSKEALALYVGLYKTYITQDKKEVETINKILYDNEVEKSKENSYNIFPKVTENKYDKEETKELVEYKDNLVRRIISKLKSIFKWG